MDMLRLIMKDEKKKLALNHQPFPCNKATKLADEFEKLALYTTLGACTTVGIADRWIFMAEMKKSAKVVLVQVIISL